MDATTATHLTGPLVAQLMDRLTAEDRRRPTPCAEWNVHQLVGHMCQGGEIVADALADRWPADYPPEPLADGPAVGWATATAALRAAATPEALGAEHETPFGEVPGEIALAVITADHLVHAWDLAQATEQELMIDDELAEWALRVWQAVAPGDDRTGNAFAEVIPTPDDAAPTDRLLGFTGRQP